jgi:hypothetical protein
VKPVFADRAALLLAPLDAAVASLPTPAASPGALVTPAAQPGAPPAASLVTQPSEQAKITQSMAKLILEYCQAARSVPAIMDKVGIKHRSYFKKNHLDPLVEAGFITPTYPSKSRHPDQGYIITDAGRARFAQLSQ